MGVIQTTLGGRFLRAKLAAARALGFETPADLMAEPATARCASPDQRGTAVETLLRDGAVSGSSDAPVIADPAAFGFQGSLSKPFTVAALSSVLSAVLEPQR